MSINKTILEHIIVGATPSSVEISETQKGPQVTVKVYSEAGKEEQALALALALYWRAKNELAGEGSRRRMEEAMAALHRSNQEDDGTP